jgi:hypothetical protein
MLNRWAYRLGCLGVIPFLFSGCGPGDDNLPRTVKAAGIVTCDGKPLEGASIVAMDPSGKYFARAMSDKSGSFSLDAYEAKPGAVPGKYNVTLSKTVTVDKATDPKLVKQLKDDAQHAAGGDANAANISWMNDLPAKYNSPASSGLSIVVPDDGTTALKLEISRK